MSAGRKQGLPQLSALLGVPYCQLDSWLRSVSPSSPQLPHQWPPAREVHESTQPELTWCSPSHAHQLISLAAFAAADAGKVSCCFLYSIVVMYPCLNSWRVTNLTKGMLVTHAVWPLQCCVSVCSSDSALNHQLAKDGLMLMLLKYPAPLRWQPSSALCDVQYRICLLGCHIYLRSITVAPCLLCTEACLCPMSVGLLVTAPPEYS